MIVSYYLRCDWPGCDRMVQVCHYEDHGDLISRGWLIRDEPCINTCHLCPHHGRRGWAALDRVRGSTPGEGNPA